LAFVSDGRPNNLVAHAAASGQLAMRKVFEAYLK